MWSKWLCDQITDVMSALRMLGLLLLLESSTEATDEPGVMFVVALTRETILGGRFSQSGRTPRSKTIWAVP